MRFKSILVTFLLAVGSVLPVAQAQQVSIDLVMCFDGSGSISPADFQLQVSGAGNAIESVIPRNGTIRLTVIQFATGVQVEVPPTVITDANAGSIANTVRSIDQARGLTNMGGCIVEAVNQVSGFDGTTKIIDIATDGSPTTGPDAMQAAADARAAGIDELNALGVGSGVDVNFLGALVFPQPAGGNDGFVTVVNSFQEFAEEFANKVGRETGGGGTGGGGSGGTIDEIPTLSEWAMLFTVSLLLGFGLLRLRRQR